jgi:hypothetical protein
MLDAVSHSIRTSLTSTGIAPKSGIGVAKMRASIILLCLCSGAVFFLQAADLHEAVHSAGKVMSKIANKAHSFHKGFAIDILWHASM